MAQAYTAPTWTDGSGEGISASNLQAISNALQGIVQGTDKAIHNIAINGSTITFTFVDGTIETAQAVNLKGISSVEKTSTSGRVDTYTITFTDGTTSTFTVTNGEQGYDDLAYHVDADLITDVGNNDYIPIYSTIQSTSGEKQITISDLKRNIVTPVVSGKADLTLIAPIQTTLTASKAYAVGEQFVYNQVLYKVTQAIANGAAITIGTNAVVAGSITEQMRTSVIASVTADGAKTYTQLFNELYTAVFDNGYTLNDMFASMLYFGNSVCNCSGAVQSTGQLNYTNALVLTSNGIDMFTIRMKSTGSSIIEVTTTDAGFNYQSLDSVKPASGTKINIYL